MKDDNSDNSKDNINQKEYKKNYKSDNYKFLVFWKSKKLKENGIFY